MGFRRKNLRLRHQMGPDPHTLDTSLQPNQINKREKSVRKRPMLEVGKRTSLICLMSNYLIRNLILRNGTSMSRSDNQFSTYIQIHTKANVGDIFLV